MEASVEYGPAEAAAGSEQEHELSSGLQWLIAVGGGKIGTGQLLSLNLSCLICCCYTHLLKMAVPPLCCHGNPFPDQNSAA